ncbi:MAG: hypothetical protein ACKPKO_58735, partial [Candidatus Fonsibacter sp.]
MLHCLRKEGDKRLVLWEVKHEHVEKLPLPNGSLLEDHTHARRLIAKIVVEVAEHIPVSECQR